MANILGGLNYNALLSSTDYRAYRDLVEKELITRFQLGMGHPPNTLPQSGIVDIIDPSVIAATETTRPFLITKSELDPLKVAINPGMAVTPSGAILESLGDINFPLARTQSTDVNVVFIENQLIVGGTSNLNDYQEALFSQDITDPNNLRVALIGDFNNVTLFPPSRKDNLVVLAVITCVETALSTIEIQIDLTSNTYPYNRPWFSFKDIQHRSYVGTGTVNERNPHGTSINDLTNPNEVGLFQGLSYTGQIVSRDRQVNKLLGARLCVEDVPLNRIKVDTGGSITSASVYNKLGAKYIELLTFPTRLGSVYEQSTPSRSISAELIPNTNILVLGPNEVITEPLKVEYTETTALLPPVDPATNLIVVNQPQTDELIVSGGLTYATLTNPEVDLEGSGPYPRRYKIFCVGNGTLVSWPQILLPSVRLSTLGTSIYELPRNPQFAARIRVALTKADLVSTMNVQVEINGKDESGAALTETVTLAVAEGYNDELLPSSNYDAPDQSVVTEGVFASIDNIQVVNRVDDGPLTQIQIWAEIEPGTSTATNDSTVVAEVDWNGQGISAIRDLRLITKGFTRPDGVTQLPLAEQAINQLRFLNYIAASPVITSTNLLLFSEDFEDLKYFDTVRGFDPSVQPKGVITIANNGFLAAGDTVLINTGKTLLFVSGSPDITVGQVEIGTSAAITKNNIVATVNDLTFNSGVTGALGAGNNVDLIRNSPSGASGNAFPLSAVLNNALALSLTGYNYGYDRYGECYLERHTVGLRSDRIPDNSDLNPSGYAYRRRYRSRAASLPDSQGPQTDFIVVVHEEDRFSGSSMRIRGSKSSNPQVWEPWVIMSSVTPGVKGIYYISFADQMHKVQVEFYGKARGVSVFNVVPE